MSDDLSVDTLKSRQYVVLSREAYNGIETYLTTGDNLQFGPLHVQLRGLMERERGEDGTVEWVSVQGRDAWLRKHKLAKDSDINNSSDYANVLDRDDSSGKINDSEVEGSARGLDDDQKSNPTVEYISDNEDCIDPECGDAENSRANDRNDAPIDNSTAVGSDGGSDGDNSAHSRVSSVAISIENYINPESRDAENSHVYEENAGCNEEIGDAEISN